jgi:hypothetical protein
MGTRESDYFPSGWGLFWLALVGMLIVGAASWWLWIEARRNRH